MLGRTGRLLARDRGWAIAAILAAAYVLGSMFLGGMLVGPGPSSSQGLGLAEIGPTGARLATPAFVLSFPWVAGSFSVLIGAAVGVGLSAGILLARRVLAVFRAPSAGVAPASAVAALTPAMLALVTLGACCSTLTAGVGPGAASLAGGLGSGPAASALFGGLQLGLLATSLLVQERIIQTFAQPLALSRPSEVRSRPREWLSGRRFLDGAGFQVPVLASVPLGAFALTATLVDSPGLPLGGSILGQLLHVGPSAWLLFLALVTPATLVLVAERGGLGRALDLVRALGRGVGSQYVGPARFAGGGPTVGEVFSDSWSASRSADPDPEGTALRWSDPVNRDGPPGVRSALAESMRRALPGRLPLGRAPTSIPGGPKRQIRDNPLGPHPPRHGVPLG